VNIQSIKSNDYNLNISRYVDTLKKVDVFNLNIISKQLIELDVSNQIVDSTIIGFCKELGIEPPFSVKKHQI